LYAGHDAAHHLGVRFGAEPEHVVGPSDAITSFDERRQDQNRPDDGLMSAMGQREPLP